MAGLNDQPKTLDDVTPINPATFVNGVAVTMPLEQKAVEVINDFWLAHTPEVERYFKANGLEDLRVSDIVLPDYQRIVKRSEL